MSPGRTLALLAALVVVAAAAIVGLVVSGDDDGDGDGGSEALSAEEYDSQTEAALQEFANLDQLSAPLANPESVEQYVTGVREIVTKIEDTASELEAIEPPENVASPHGDLIAAVETYGAAFPPVADAAEAGDEDALRSSAEDLQDAALEFQSEATEISQRFADEGVDLQALAG